MFQNFNSEEPRAGYFYIGLMVLMLLVIIAGIIHFLNTV